MAPMNAGSPFPADEQAAWSEAYERLQNFLNNFVWDDRAEVARLALRLLDEAKEIHRRDPSQNPTAVTMRHVQKLLAGWLAVNLATEDQPPSQALAAGYTALLLSQVVRIAPTAFLVSPVPEELRRSLRHTLLATGPDLNISSMTPRPLDYGPMLDLAKQTWHRWNTREIVLAALFWTAIYFIFYWWLSNLP